LTASSRSHGSWRVLQVKSTELHDPGQKVADVQISKTLAYGHGRRRHGGLRAQRSSDRRTRPRCRQHHRPAASWRQGLIPEGSLAIHPDAVEALSALVKAGDVKGVAELRRKDQVISVFSTTVKVTQVLADGMLAVKLLETSSKFSQVNVGQTAYLIPGEHPRMRIVR
jgi:hypothetical protein